MKPREHAMILLGLALAAPCAAHAMPPPQPPPCVPASAKVSLQALAAVMAGQGEYSLRECASNDLVARGAAATPVVVALLGSGDVTTLHLALATIRGLGPQAAGALPVLLKRADAILAIDYGNSVPLFDAIAAVGSVARPAIPMLIARSRQDAYAYGAQMALGKLGQYDAPIVVPHLVSQLKRVDLDTVAYALGEIGKPAKAALPALKAYLKRAIAADGKGAEAAMGAIARIDDPKNSVPFLLGYLEHPTMAPHAIDQLSLLGASAAAAVPALVRKLNASRGAPAMRDRIVGALRSMAPTSVAAQEQLLVEATQYRNEYAAVALSEVNPLPHRFVPALKKVADGKPASYFFNKALANAEAGK
jgi:hypothetical protein